ncbi:hypothetical protein PoB_000594500 [Plakobranchus ocellatus]|uniref:G-protein coupled receptors family 1 profile domain-containing protein n=1 Tax=Plakobranchus ocellatus TaxID=259542 RepID=A0AAV3Y9J6_9GAST|nr:hypothetical protein PoB_000594500 [Plakobranchus ocellatus]
MTRQPNMSLPITNTTMGLVDVDDVDDQPEGHIEAYTVVLSLSSHVVALVAGGISNVALLAAMAARGGAGSKLSIRGYSQVLTLVAACLAVCFVWCPLEAADLLEFHHTGRHLFRSHLTLGLKTALHVFLLILVCAVLVLLAVEAALRLVAAGTHGSSTSSSSLAFYQRWCATGRGNRLWPPVASGLAILAACVLAATYIATSLQDTTAYVDTESGPRTVLLALTSLVFCLTTVAGLALLILLLKDRVYWEDGRPHLKPSSAKLVVPDFLISQSAAAAAADNTGGYDPSTATPSPSTPKLLAVVGCETGREDVSPISDLPAAKSLGNRLGVNMAQVLGRRRHTICQIGDSSNGGGGGGPGGGTTNDPINKAKQYNYVRKFSVDIAALQAQLQNPKSFKDAPFQSDMDLTKRPNGEGGAAQGGKVQPEPLLPLKPLPKRFDGKAGGEGGQGGGGGGGPGLGVGGLTTTATMQRGTPPLALKNGPAKTSCSPKMGVSDHISAAPVQTPPQPPPPVIMVSIDDDCQSNHNNDKDGEADDDKHPFHPPQDADENTPLNPDANTNAIPDKDASNTCSVTTPAVDNCIITTTAASPPAKKPTSLAFKDPSQQYTQQQQQQHRKSSCCGEEQDSVENHTHRATLDSDLSYTSADGEDGEQATAERLAKLVLLLCACFLLALLPVALTELLRGTLTFRTYVNTRACVVAVWALQTLVYPHLLAWGDRNLHRAVRRHNRRFVAALETHVGAVCCPCCCSESAESRSRHGEDTSSTSQV